MGNKLKRVLKAFDNKDLSLLTTLIAQQCLDPNQLIPEKGVSCFHLIIGHQSENFALKVIKLFLRCGGDPNVASEDGVTPIHVAAAWGRTRILHLLLVNGGDPWIQDDDRKNAFNYAFEQQEWDAVEMLHHFQQMHSSAACRTEVEQNPKFEFNFERILSREREIVEHASAENCNLKSSRPQVENFQKMGVISPVLNKIKYFESHTCNWDVGGNEAEKCGREYSKGRYQTSCEFIVNAEESNWKSEGDSEKRFISSIHIDASPLKTEEVASKNSTVSSDKPCNGSADVSGDVRSRLFTELQEAVLRRSRLKMHGREGGNGESGVSEPSVIEVDSKSKHSVDRVSHEATDRNYVVVEKNPSADEVSYLYGGDLSNNSLLKHMSDFATKVMEEMEERETEGEEEESEKAKEIPETSPNVLMTSTYLTCEDESDFGEDEGRTIKTIALPREDAKNCSLMETSNDSFLTVAECKYTDPEDEVILVEKKLRVTPDVSDVSFENFEMQSNASSMFSDVSSVLSATSYASDVLRNELTSFGFNPGPITKTTKKLYLRKLWRLKKGNKRTSRSEQVYPAELEKTLKNEMNLKRILRYAALEEEMIRTFDEHPKRKWREGRSKTSFNYLLLDPRISLNLPRRAVTMSDPDIWQCFLSSIFYVGKGKRTRPYAHLYEAASSWQKDGFKVKCNEKVEHILEIWSENLGVICLQVFQNIMAVEAYTREAAMIDAVGLVNLKNVKSGEYYGSPATWIAKDKSKLGILLLYKSMLIYLSEGERQIRPLDIA